MKVLYRIFMVSLFCLLQNAVHSQVAAGDWKPISPTSVTAHLMADGVKTFTEEGVYEATLATGVYRLYLTTTRTITYAVATPHIATEALTNTALFYKIETVPAPAVIAVTFPTGVTNIYLPVSSGLTNAVNATTIPAIPAVTRTILLDKPYTNPKKLKAKNNNGLRYGSRPKRAILGFNFAPSFAYRRLYINNADAINADVNAEFLKRKGTETFDFGFTTSLSVGYAYKAHHIYAEGILMQQGFKTISNGIDWSTGKIIAGKATTYKVVSIGAGVGYSYRKFWYLNKVGCIIDGGLYISKPFPQSPSTSVDFGKAIVGLKAGVGLSFRPDYLNEIRLMPVVYYNFTNSSRGAAFGTHFINAGMNLSWTLHLNKKLL